MKYFPFFVLFIILFRENYTNTSYFEKLQCQSLCLQFSCTNCSNAKLLKTKYIQLLYYKNNKSKNCKMKIKLSV